MSDYGVLHFAFWDSATLEQTDPDARLLAAFLIAGRHTRAGVPGLFHGGLGTLSEAMRLHPKIVEAGLGQLLDIGFAEQDEKHRVIRVPNAPLFQRPQNPNMLRGWFNRWRTYPRSALVGRHVESIKAAVNGRPHLESVFEETFGSEDLNRFETVAEPFGKGSRTHGVSVSVSVSASPGKRGAGEKGRKQHPDMKAFTDAFQARYMAANNGAKPTWGPKQLAVADALLRAHGLQPCLLRVDVLFCGRGPAWLKPPFDLLTLHQHFDKLTGVAPAQAGLTFEQLVAGSDDPFGGDQ